jgi:hypothetical protein
LTESIALHGISSGLDQRLDQRSESFECRFVQRSAAIVGMNTLRICASAEKQGNNSYVAVQDGFIERGIAVCIGCGRIGMGGQEQVDNLRVASRGRDMKDGLIVPETDVDSRAVSEKQSCDRQAPGQDGILQPGGARLAMRGIRVGSMGEKELRDFRIAGPCSIQQGCAAQRVAHVYVGTRLDELSNLREIAGANGGV